MTLSRGFSSAGIVFSYGPANKILYQFPEKYSVNPGWDGNCTTRRYTPEPALRGPPSCTDGPSLAAGGSGNVFAHGPGGGELQNRGLGVGSSLRTCHGPWRRWWGAG